MEPHRFWQAQGFDEVQIEELRREITPWENDIGGLAFILAHEVGHNVLGHPPGTIRFLCDQHLQAIADADARAQRRDQKDAELEAQGKKVGLWRKLGRALGTISSESVNSMVGSLEFTRYRQGAEDEADRLGILILREVGLDPRAGARSLDYLASVYAYAESNREVMATFLCSDHPHILQRVDNADVLAGQLVGDSPNSAEWPLPVDLTPSRLGYVSLRFQAAYQQEDFGAALEWIEAGLRYAPEEAGLLYNKACMLARTGQPDESLDVLELVVKMDPSWATRAETDLDFASLKEYPRFKVLVGADSSPE
jgi:predicted Zn-dependent protease